MSIVKVFALEGSQELAGKVCVQLAKKLHPMMVPNGPAGMMGRVNVSKFANGNVEVQVDDVRGCYAVVIHTQTPPVNDELIQLFAMLHALTNASPENICVMFSYMPYARSDRKDKPRISVMGDFVAKTLSYQLGIKNVILLDPHSEATKQYFWPVYAEEIWSSFLVADYIERHKFVTGLWKRDDCVILYSDEGAARRFKKYMRVLQLPAAFVDKERMQGDPRPAGISGDVRGKICILVDDELMTGGTALSDAELARTAGAQDVVGIFTHGVLANEKFSSTQEFMRHLAGSSISQFLFTNSIPGVAEKIAGFSNMEIIPAEGLIAEGISRKAQMIPLSPLYSYENVHEYRIR